MSYTTDYNIHSAFRNESSKWNEEFSDDDWIERREELLLKLHNSLSLIGNGSIAVKDHYDMKGDRLMYKEYFENEQFILVIHAAFEKHPYGGGKRFRYEIGVYKNDSTKISYGYGYGNSGINMIQHTCLIGSSENYCRNEKVISRVANEFKKYTHNNFSKYIK